MDIQGIQKMSMLDFPGKLACTVFLAGCNMRCPYCHNSELIDGTAPKVMTTDDLMEFLKKRKGMLEGVVVTGGEPMLRKDLGDLLAGIKELGYAVKVDTNGTSPKRLKQLVEAGLIDYIAMDIKNSPERYAATAGVEGFDLEAVEESISYLKEGHVDFEFRTTVVNELHDVESMKNLAKWIAGDHKYFIQKFVDRDTVVYGNLNSPSEETLEAMLAAVKTSLPDAKIRNS